MNLKQTIFLLLFTCTTVNYAQKNVVKVNPLGFFYDYIQVAYERALNDDETSIELMIESTQNDSNYSNFTGVLAEIKYKFFFPNSRRVAPFGLYSAPLINYETLKNSANSSDKVLALSGGVVTGLQFNLGANDTGLTLDLNFGSQYSFFFVSEDVEDTNVEGFQPRAAISLGFSF